MGHSQRLSVMCGAAAALACVAVATTPGATIALDSGIPGRRFDGIGGLFAIGGARLLYEYPSQQRTDVLDLLFGEEGGGRKGAYSILKVGNQRYHCNGSANRNA